MFGEGDEGMVMRGFGMEGDVEWGDGEVEGWNIGGRMGWVVRGEGVVWGGGKGGGEGVNVKGMVEGVDEGR